MVRVLVLTAFLALLPLMASAQNGCFSGPSGSVCPAGTTGPSALTVHLDSGGGGGGGGGGSVTQGTTPWVDNISQFGGVTVNIGQQVMASSMPVTIASNQSPLAVAESGTWNVGLTGTLPAFAATPTFVVGAGSAAIGSVTVSSIPAVTNAGTFAVQNTAATPAGTNQIGSVSSGGYTAASQLAPTVTASAYTAGYSIGGLMTFTGLVRSTQATALVQKVVASFADTQTPTLDLILFNASPTSSTTTDHTAFSLAGSDIAKVIGVIHVTDCSAAGTPTICQAQQQGVPIVLPSNGASLFGVLVTRAAITPVSTSDLTVILGSLED